MRYLVCRCIELCLPDLKTLNLEFRLQQAQQSSTKVASQLATTRTGTDQRGRSTSILSTLSSQPRSASSVVIDHGSPETISEETMIDDEPSDMELRVRDEKKVRYFITKSCVAPVISI